MVAPNAGPRGPGFDSASGNRMSGDIPVDMRDSSVLGQSPIGNVYGAPPTPGAAQGPAGYGGYQPGYGQAAGGLPATGPMPAVDAPGYGNPPSADGYAQQSQLGSTGGFTPGGTFARFKERSPVMVVFLAFITCGIYSVLWFAKTADEMRDQGQTLPPSWHLIIPILNLIWIWRWCEALERLTNGQEKASTNFFIHFFLGPIGLAIVQSKLNDL
jgi:Domain of unknown function (DUF4234)